MKTSEQSKKLTQRNRGRYQNSVCRRGHLHDFLQVKETKTGFLERCRKCGVQLHFPANVPNHIYLSFHVRSALQPSEPMFLREFPNAPKD